MDTYGLIGRNISYSFSKNHFTQKFASEGIAATYLNFDIPDISEFSKLKNTPNLRGANITIPYKEQVIPFLDELDPHAVKIGAVNTIKFGQNGKTIGYNTDFIGFRDAIAPFLLPKHKKALILGTGGASKAIAYALEQLCIPYRYVSRIEKPGQFSYLKINETVLQEYQIIINCTPLGTFPNVEEAPAIPFWFLSSKHLVFDLVYNPRETKLMKMAKAKGATVSNGLEMLKIQAEEAWKIWNF